MSSSRSPDLTDLLVAWGQGDREAAERFLPVVYDELRRMAQRHLSHERRDHTLQPAALVHEAYLRLIRQKKIAWKNRRHFFGLAGSMMRRILVDHARGRQREKRGGKAVLLTLDSLAEISVETPPGVIELDTALRDLATFDPLKASIVELHFFAGLSVAETAEVVERSTATVTRHWRLARAWLFRKLSEVHRHGS